MTCRTCTQVLAILLIVPGTQSARVDLDGVGFPNFMRHCATQSAGDTLCWEGLVGEGRLKAICGGTQVEGRCSDSGFVCDSSGASVERFSMFLGLNLMTELPCDGKQIDLKGAMMAGTLQSNGLCPTVMKTVRKWHEDASGQISNITHALAGCSRGIATDDCADTLAELSIPIIAHHFLHHFEEHHGILWAKRLVAVYDARPVIERGADLVDQVVDIPESVKEFADKLHMSLTEPIKVAKKMLELWHDVESLLLKLFEPVLKIFVSPVFGTILNQFPEMYDEHVEGALKHAGTLHRFQASLKEKLDGVLDNVEALCHIAPR